MDFSATILEHRKIETLSSPLMYRDSTYIVIFHLKGAWCLMPVLQRKGNQSLRKELEVLRGEESRWMSDFVCMYFNKMLYKVQFEDDPLEEESVCRIVRSARSPDHNPKEYAWDASGRTILFLLWCDRPLLEPSRI
ncbi:hypothetical protein AVEN_152108-1 [Araneus ventricosus]|uniref:Uncharacterized protein n=1 Tax=Araneus ventricosus TaxID=182803 RepID=A0A4Y2R758_ARAVE|nr:hypothetical protein AVEN_152108-1 [Araneus ventricosus]